MGTHSRSLRLCVLSNYEVSVCITTQSLPFLSRFSSSAKLHLDNNVHPVYIIPLWGAFLYACTHSRESKMLKGIQREWAKERVSNRENEREVELNEYANGTHATRNNNDTDAKSNRMKGAYCWCTFERTNERNHYHNYVNGVTNEW